MHEIVHCEQFGCTNKEKSEKNENTLQVSIKNFNIKYTIIFTLEFSYYQRYLRVFLVWDCIVKSLPFIQLNRYKLYKGEHNLYSLNYSQNITFSQF